MTPVKLPCSQCGKDVFEKGRKNAFVRGKLEPFAPVFCSKKCADKFNPSALANAMISGLTAWIPEK